VGMSNTRNTPVEVLELECPVRVRRYALRTGSGGVGECGGGDGVIREFEALAETEVSLLTERRRHAPRGVAGGANGATGRNLVNGRRLPAKSQVRLKAGDVLTLETPGGGGYGKAQVPKKKGKRKP
jgi:N-methylhydantoinase B